MTVKQMTERLQGLSGTKALEGFAEVETRRTKIQAWGQKLQELGEMKDSDRLTRKQVEEINQAFGLDEQAEAEPVTVPAESN